MKSASILILNILFISLAMMGCNQKDNTTGDAPDSAQQPSAMDVRYIEIQPALIARTDQLPGRVVSYQVAEIRPQVSGIIESRLFKEGTHVDEGQKLYQIDPARYEADLQLAQSTLEDAQARYENAQNVVNRYENLIETNAISQQQYDDAIAAQKRAKAAVGMAEAEVSIAQINLGYTSVHSPISGYISPSTVTKGALVTALQVAPLATVRQLDPVYIDLSQTAAEARNLQARLNAARGESVNGAEFPVTLFPGNTSEAYPKQGVLNATDLAVDLQTGAIRLRSIFPNPDVELLPGMFVRASIENVGRAEEIVVPQKAVRIGPNGAKTLWLIDTSNKARQRTIETGASYKNNWIVLDGLEAGDRVIVEGTMGLSDGAVVNAQQIDPQG